MKLVGRKTRKAIRKSVKKIVKKHGGKIATGLASGVASSLATLAKTEAPGTGGKSNLKQASKKVSDMLAGEEGKRSRKGGRDRKKFGNKRTGPKRTTARGTRVERAM
jgi:hypothetical protein